VIIEARPATEVRVFDASERMAEMSFGGVRTPLIWTMKMLLRSVEFDIVICGLGAHMLDRVLVVYTEHASN
jgi:hypothetical protein